MRTGDAKERDGASKSEQTARVSVRPSRAMQEWFRERSRIESVSVGRRLSQNTELNQPAKAQKELETVSLFSSKSQRLKAF